MENTKVEFLKGLNYKGWLPALTTNIRLRREWVIVANTLAYYDIVKISGQDCGVSVEHPSLT
jgi:hypothetical protein